MAPTLQDCQAQALQLGIKDRAELAHILIKSIDEPSEQEIEAMWAQEIERRCEAYEQGKIASYSYEEVMKEAREILKS